MINKRYGGIMVVVLLTLLPVVFWVAMGVGGRFAGTVAIFRSLGQLTALVGMALFSINLIIVSRTQITEKLFWGLNRIYNIHHFIGGFAFILLLFHPVFIVSYNLFISPQAAFSYIFPSFSSFELWFGIFGLLCMIAALFITFYMNIAYHVWKITHQLLAPAFFLGGLHMFFIASDVSRSNILRYYMLGLAVLGVLSIVWRMIINVRVVKRFTYKVKDVRKISNSVTELTLSPVKGMKNYEAGQFAFLRIASKTLSRESHPYSMVSVSNDPELKFVIKNLGDYTKNISSVSVGDSAFVEGPFGKFSYLHVDNKRQIWVAGGIGLTPFLGMARDLLKRQNREYDIDLFYTVKNQSELIFEKELRDMHDWGIIRLHLTLSDNEGYLTFTKIKNECNIVGADVLICGPQTLMTAIGGQAKEAGIDPRRIHSEEFSLY